MVSVSESPVYEWLLTYSVPLRELTAKTDLIRNVTIPLFIGFAAVTTLLSILFAMNVTRPLKKLSGLMREAEQGRFRPADEHALNGAEVGTLARSFNSMVITIEELIDKNVKIETSQKEAELYALQSQINPHFIYNTLETIGMAVEEGEREAVVDMVTLLGRMLRFSVGNQSKFVTAAEELQHVRDYLTIQQFRFEDRLRFTFEERLPAAERSKLYTPKFILQPIVENAIKHGLEARKQLEIGIRLQVAEAEDGGELVFAVCDNGPGIPEEKLAELNRQLDGTVLKKSNAGFGLTNVHARIRLMLGKPYGLQMHSAPGKGTEVTLRIPVIRVPYGTERYLHGKGDSGEHD
ncbi:sensor histidine kinase [Paenibacillus chartarius]|uniref:histidine kinase n=1 Tax=Paenibacillus chartarius TaxID=747481 RepID=A0ABV6DUE0_9BACL